MSAPMVRWAWNKFRLMSTSDPKDGNAVLVCDVCHMAQDTGTFFPPLHLLLATAQNHETTHNYRSAT